MKESVIGTLNFWCKNLSLLNTKYYCHIFTTGAYGPSMRLAEPSMIRRNPALDRLPASRVARGGKGELPVNQ